jgi:transposase-like protein
MSLVRLPGPSTPARSAFTGFRFPREVIVLSVRWYLRFGLSYRDVEELLAERGIDVDHVTVHRWVRRFAPLLANAARFGRHRVGDRWHVDETYVKVAGRWVYLYRAVDQFGQVIDVYASSRRDRAAARRFFQRAGKATGVVPVEVITDRAPAYPRVLDQLWPAAWHHVEQYANNPVEADHAQLKRRLRPMRGIKTLTGLRILAAGHAFVQNLRSGHYEIAPDQPRNLRLAVTFRQLATAI